MKLADSLASQQRKSEEVQHPPGLDPVGSKPDSLTENLACRVELLERVFVLVDFEALEAAAQFIVAKSMPREPECELSPMKPDMKTAGNSAQAVFPQVPEFPGQDLLPACEECCEHPSSSGGTTKFAKSTGDSTSLESLTVHQQLELIVDKLDSSKILNS